MEMQAVGINLHAVTILRCKKLFNKSPELLQSRLFVDTLQFAKYTFPKHYIYPTGGNKLFVVHRITESIAFDFLFPEIRIR